jgi:DNA polymerase III epsilon subunit-like protein
MTLCFIDTETTSLRPDRRAWEIAIITEETGTEYRWFVHHADLDLGNADLMSLRVGGFHNRHPSMISPDAEWHDTMSERAALEQVERITRGAHLVGAVPSFDAEVLATRMRANGICPSWHHHLVDIEAMAVGWRLRTLLDIGRDDEVREQLVPPWKSDDLSHACGVEPAGEDERHTALGDARWVKRWYEAIVGGAA